MNARKLLSAAKAVEPVFIEDTFAVHLYTGTGSTQTITNGIDLAGKGGLVWIKQRSVVNNHFLAHAATVRLRSDTTNANVTTSDGVTSFNSNGFSIGANANLNGATDGSIVSWTFRKQAKFFDVVTYTGNGSNRTIAHNLGSVPGCIIVKRTDTTADWQVYHRSLANTEYLVLNSTAAKATGTTRWNSTTPTATEFSLGTDTTVNANTGTYVAYLFAHDAGGFGQSGSDNVISCGSFTTAASGYSSISLGYEPQWLLIKTTGVSQNWFVFDNMRGFVVTGNSPSLSPNTSAAEDTSVSNAIRPTATGFDINADYFGGSRAYIYIAIRRGPMKTPTTGTSVFVPATRAGTGATATTSNLTFPPDVVWSKGRDNGGTNSGGFDRLRGATKQLSLNQSDAEITASTSLTGFDVMTGYTAGADAVQLTINATGYNYVNWNFRRAPGFFDVVCYTGTGSATTFSHNLGVAPELMIVKARDLAGYNFIVYSKSIAITDVLYLNATNGNTTFNAFNSTQPTSSVFSVSNFNAVNQNTYLYVAYLFATCPGVSKVGSYTGTGNTLQIDCGFTGGARFVLIKRTDSTGDWYVWDSARGIVAGNDPYLLLNSTAAEVTTTDWVDTYSAGFELSNAGGNNANINTATYVFLAVA